MNTLTSATKLVTSPDVHEWTGPTGVKFRDMREPSGTYYRDTTPRAVIDALERALSTKQRVRLFYGDRETGRDWLEENDVCGTVGRSTGRYPIVLLIPSPRSMGGGAILADCIVRILVEGREVYRHPNYREPLITIWKEGEYPHLPWAANVASDNPHHINPHARFRTELAATRWAAFMRGERMGK